MAQTNFTPILIYASSTPTNVPIAANLTNSATGSELAINIADKNLFFKDSTNAVNTVPIRQSSTSSNGWLSATDWNTFNNKGSGTVTSVAATVPAFLSISGSPITTSGTLAITLSGTALPVANGGTGLTTLTAGYVPFGNGTSAFGSESSLFWDNTNKRLGIGNSSPAYALDVALSMKTGANVFCGDAYAFVFGTGTTTYLTGSSSTNYIAAYTSSAERTRVASSGEFLVGCTSLPASNRTLGWGAKTHSTGGFQVYQVSSNSDWAINSSSGFICNFYSDNGAALTYAGSISVNGVVTTYGSVSDYRLKENVAPITKALNIVSQLKPVTYSFKNNGQKSQGFIAHELQAIVPDCVTGKKDAVKEDGTPDYQGVDTSFLIATLVAAIQELNSKFDAYVASHP